MNNRIVDAGIFSLVLMHIGLVVASTMSPFIGRIDAQIPRDGYATFYEWKAACDELPPFQAHSDNPCITPLTEQLLNTQINLFLRTMWKCFANVAWVNNRMPQFDQKGISNHFESYIEKVELPTDATIAIHGDLHGDVHAINRFIQTFLERGYLDEENPFKIKNKNFYMVFLGDYVDRGWYGPEVIYTILRLKNENPQQVFMVRGNHEDILLSTNGYGFGDEILKRFPRSFYLTTAIANVYNVLPLALYIVAGVPANYNVIQCCHGGIEIGVDPRPLFKTNGAHACMEIHTLMQAEGFAHLASLGPESLKHFFKNNKPLTTMNGFMWTDFILDPSKVMALSPRDGQTGNIFEYGKKATEQLLGAWSSSSHTFRAIFRGHQHDFNPTPMRRRILNDDGLSHPYDAGVGKLWVAPRSIHQEKPALLRDISVVTFSVAPHTGYGWPYHAFGQLTLAPAYQDWRLQVFRLTC